jgi:putative NADH-flavin reductase
VVVGSVTDGGPSLAEAMRGQDAVISALGVGSSLKSSGLIARSIPLIVKAMQGAAVRRLVFTSTYGVGATLADVPLLPRLLIGTLLRDLYIDKAAGEDILRQNDLDWTLVYPVTLTNKPGTGHYRTGEHLALRGLPTVSRSDVADFLIKQVEDPTYVRRGVLIGA